MRAAGRRKLIFLENKYMRSITRVTLIGGFKSENVPIRTGVIIELSVGVDRRALILKKWMKRGCRK